jgi:O-antigen ligase
LPASHYSAVRDVLLVALALVGFIGGMKSRSLRIPTSAISLPLMLFVALVATYLLFAPNLLQGLLGAKALALYGVLYFVVVAHVRSRAQVKPLVWGVTLMVVALTGYGFFAFLVPQTFFPYDPTVNVIRIWDGTTRLHFSGYTYLLAQIMPMLWLAAHALAGSRVVRIALFAVSTLTAVLLALSELRAAWLAAAVATAVYLGWRGRHIVPAAIAVAGAIAIAVVVWPDVLSRVSITGSRTDIGFTGRIYELQAFWFPLLSQHPWGLGTGTFSSSASASWQAITGSFTFSYDSFGATGVTHNGFLEIFGELGVVGFAVYVWLIGAIAIEGFANFRRLRTPLERGLNAICLGQVASYCALNFFVPAPVLFPVNFYFFLSAGLIVALRNIAIAEGQSEHDPIADRLELISRPLHREGLV